MRDKQAQMALARQRLLTLAYGEMETIRMVRPVSLYFPDLVSISFLVAE
jgi:hypothetical protein